MLNIDRRSFLKGVLSVTVVAGAGVPSLGAPLLKGDGVHDDTDALRALFSGKSFRCENEVVAVRRKYGIDLSGGKFRINSTIYVPEQFVNIYNCTFYCTEDFKDDCALRLEIRNISSIEFCHCVRDVV